MVQLENNFKHYCSSSSLSRYRSNSEITFYNVRLVAWCSTSIVLERTEDLVYVNKFLSDKENEITCPRCLMLMDEQGISYRNTVPVSEEVRATQYPQSMFHLHQVEAAPSTVEHDGIAYDYDYLSQEQIADSWNQSLTADNIVSVTSTPLSRASIDAAAERSRMVTGIINVYENSYLSNMNARSMLSAYDNSGVRNDITTSARLQNGSVVLEVTNGTVHAHVITEGRAFVLRKYRNQFVTPQLISAMNHEFRAYLERRTQ